MSNFSLSRQALLLALAVALVVGGIGSAIVGWQGINNARATVEKDMRELLVVLDGALQMAYRSTSEQGVKPDEQAAIAFLSETRALGVGRLVVMAPGELAGSWRYLVHPTFKGKTLAEAMQAGDAAIVAGLLKQPEGFVRANFANNPTPTLMAWRKVPHWGWTVFAVGPEPIFMEAAYRELIVVAVLLFITGLAIAGLIAYRMSVALRPVRGVVTTMQHLGAGDLSQRPPAAVAGSRNEVQVLYQALGDMYDGLSRTVRAVRNGVSEINVGTREIASGNIDLSSRTEEQAASLQETAASMEELASTVKQNADNARQANELVAGAADVAKQGGKAVADVVSMMQDINASSARIGEIVSVIDGIAFQTNILALNAAVEAARAGEQGKGFAVVAGEVRALAQRSAQAAREIKQLIVDSGEQVQAGTRLVGSAGDTMKGIVEAVSRVAQIMSEIAAASQEQSSGIDQVNQAVVQMDSVTQQNAALVEQAASAAAALEEQAGRLEQAVAVFRLGHGEAGYSEVGYAASRPRALLAE